MSNGDPAGQQGVTRKGPGRPRKDKDKPPVEEVVNPQSLEEPDPEQEEEPEAEPEPEPEPEEEEETEEEAPEKSMRVEEAEEQRYVIIAPIADTEAMLLMSDYDSLAAVLRQAQGMDGVKKDDIKIHILGREVVLKGHRLDLDYK